MTYALSAIGFTAGSIAVLSLLVHAIDRLDKWGRKNRPTWIIVPEQREPANVIVLDERRAS